MMTTTEHKAERCAVLLQHTMVTNSDAYFCLELPSGTGILESIETKPDVPLKFVTAFGIGSQCRWMLVPGLLIILFGDGRYVYKVPPEGFRYSSDNPYRLAFSFSNASTDVIVLNTVHRTYILHVRGMEVEEETLELNAFCYDGYFDEHQAGTYFLVGQTPRPQHGPTRRRGKPLLIEVNGSKFRAAHFHGDGLEKIESIVSIATVADRTLLLCAEGAESMEDDPLEETPYILDHFRFYIVDAKSRVILAHIKFMNFLSVAGPKDDPRIFFSEVNFKPGTSGVVSCSLRDLLSSGRCELEPLVLDQFARSYSIGIVRYDEQIGFTSLASENPRPGMNWFLWSKDGKHWERQAIGK
jgi:hypothetical protein